MESSEENAGKILEEGRPEVGVGGRTRPRSAGRAQASTWVSRILKGKSSAGLYTTKPISEIGRFRTRRVGSGSVPGQFRVSSGSVPGQFRTKRGGSGSVPDRFWAGSRMVPSRFQISSKAVPGLVPTQFQASSKAVLKWRLMAQSLSTDLSPSDSDGLRSKTKFAMRI